MIDWKRKYCEVGYNAYGIKYTQDGKFYRLDGKEVNQKGEPIAEPFMTEDDWAGYEPELPKSEVDRLREALDAKGISWHPNAKEETLRKKLEAAE